MNTISEEPPLTGRNQVEDTTNTTEAMPTYLPPRAAAMLAGFNPDSPIRDAYRRHGTHVRSDSDTHGYTTRSQRIGRPLEKSESFLDPNMNRARSNAILFGFAPRPEDVERNRASLERRRWVDADRNSGPMEERERNRFNRYPTTYPYRGGGGLPPNNMGARGLYAGQYPTSHESTSTGGASVGTGGYTPFGSNNSHSSVPDQSSSRNDDRSAAVYDPGSFEDTDQFYIEPAPKPESIDPKTMSSQPECKPGGNSNPSKRKDEPDDEPDRGGSGASEQAT